MKLSKTVNGDVLPEFHYMHLHNRVYLGFRGGAEEDRPWKFRFNDIGNVAKRVQTRTRRVIEQFTITWFDACQVSYYLGIGKDRRLGRYLRFFRLQLYNK
jgi:hypothetical protein